MSVNKTGSRRQYEPPSPSLEGYENIEEAFLKDVEKLHDKLPQPFRRIDKILWQVFEHAWVIIEQNEAERRYKQSKQVDITKLLYEEELIIHSPIHSLAVCDSYVFIGGSTDVVSYKLPSLSKINSFKSIEKDNSYIDQLLILAVSDDTVLLLLVEKEGAAIVLGFKCDNFYEVAEFHKNQRETEDIVFAEIVSISEDKCYVGISWKDSSSQWLDIYKLPLEEWLACLEKIHLATQTNLNDGETQQNEENLESPPPQFSPMDHILHISPHQVKANNTNISSLLKNMENNIKMIGAGSYHPLSSSFFNHLHNEFKLKSKWAGDGDFNTRSETAATVHFLKGQLISSFFSSRNAPSEDMHYNSVAVFWKGRNTMYIYSLKSVKEPSPISMLPHSDAIILSAVNSRTDLIATSLANCCISVWNRYTGQPLKVLTPAEYQSITTLRFSSVYHGCLQSRLTYATSDGKLYQMTCEKNDTLADPVLMDDRRSAMFDHDIVLKTISGPMNLLTVIWQSGEVVIYNEASSSPLCQLELFTSTASQQGAMLNVGYTKGNIVVCRDESNELQDISRLFLFDPDEHNILQPFFHFQFGTEDVEEAVDGLEKFFLRFLRRRKLSEESLQSRIATQHRELFKSS